MQRDTTKQGAEQMKNVNIAKMETSLFFNNGYKIRVATFGYVFIGLLSSASFERVYQIEIYKVEEGLEMFQGYANQGGEIFGRLAGPLLEAAKQERRAAQQKR